MKKVNRLKKIAMMPPEMFEGTLNQISDRGRAILKSIEDYKFYIDQTLRMVKNDPALGNIINQKKKNLDHAAQDLYNIVFEIENIDITAAYNEQEEKIQNGEEGAEPPVPGQPATPNGVPQPQSHQDGNGQGTPPPATPMAPGQGFNPPASSGNTSPLIPPKPPVPAPDVEDKKDNKDDMEDDEVEDDNKNKENPKDNKDDKDKDVKNKNKDKDKKDSK